MSEDWDHPSEPVGGTPRVIIIHSPKMPGGVMKGYVAEEDYRQLERELAQVKEENRTLHDEGILRQAIKSANEQTKRAENAEREVAEFRTENEYLKRSNPCRSEQLAGLRADAGRYRIWRKNTALIVPSCEEATIDRELDAAIDALKEPKND